ncbi:cyclin-like protein [Cercophora scortea]|uniref:RNA polymerase II holoenzyme cyclin-like subunit n=1 Tax=Cercophora scortea TaxID=314031 RepID=A0AAE0J417_9PEZI|nr:cyclin-like protein [Cercophora scortea]
MSSNNIDRYRPPREGYQPPSLPPKPPPPFLDRPSKSPVRRRDVPPPAPSPPTLSSRTSPPLPHSHSRAHSHSHSHSQSQSQLHSYPSRRSVLAPSPARPSSPRLPPARPDQWLFTADEVASTPTIIDEIPVAEERLRRAKGVNFIFQVGILLEIPQLTLWVAAVFFHRFYMRYSMAEEKGGIHHYNIAATALFLANKTEENCRRTKDLIIAVGKVAQKNAKAVIDEQSKEYWRWRDSILTYEELMLETLTFDLMVETPYTHLYDYLNQLQIVHDKQLRNSAWAFCNDACLTVLPLLLGASDISVAAIFFAVTVTKETIADVDGQPWWKFLKGDERLIITAISIMTEFYKENPLRKQDSKVPSSPEFNLENTRRRGETIVSQTEAESVHNATPFTDRGTQSPPRGAGGPIPVPTTTTTTAAKPEPQLPRLSDIKERDTSQAPAAIPTTTSVEVKKEEPAESTSIKIDTRGDSDVALKAAANDLDVHEGNPSENGLVSPAGIKRNMDLDLGRDSSVDEPEKKKARLSSSDFDEGEIS